MENIDALLDDLKATNDQMLISKKASNMDHISPVSSIYKTDVWSFPKETSLKNVNRNMVNNSQIVSLQDNLSTLNNMLHRLQNIDSENDHHYQMSNNSQPVELNPSGSFNTQLYSQENQNLIGSNEIYEPMSSQTRDAAAFASAQLDDLMNSLQLLKFKTAENVFDSATTNNHIDTLSETSNVFQIPKPLPFNELKPIENDTKVEVSAEVVNSKHELSNDNSDKIKFNSSLQPDVHSVPGNVLQGDTCVYCNKPVIGKVISALGGIWHPEHFNCASCQTTVVEDDFFEHDCAPYCTDCHLSLFAPKCAYCGEAILTHCLEAMNMFWHSEHFFCQSCHSPFSDSSTAHENAGKIYCFSCYHSLFGTRCGGCKQIIRDGYITALAQCWHEDCFRCKDCSIKLSGQSYFSDNGFLFCEQHYRGNSGYVCPSCSKLISGRCINAMGKRFHVQHFVCSYCQQQLNTGTFKEKNNKPYCSPCFRKMFG